MREASYRRVAWGAMWREFWATLAPACSRGHANSAWSRLRRRSRGVRLMGARYCRSECLQLALAEALQRSGAAARSPAIASHRIPLGLLLLSRQQITPAQLREVLEAQRGAGSAAKGNAASSRGTSGPHQGTKKIGAWLQEKGYSTEQEVTAALARQWSCPLLRFSPSALSTSRSPEIPYPLLEFFRMIPVALVEATGTLLMAFSEGIDYTALYAIEQLLGYRTEACLICPSVLQKSLLELAQRRDRSDVVFEHAADAVECARIAGNYSLKLGAEELRFAYCGEHLWIRLARRRKATVNLLLRVGG
jgi:Type II secretion system (T2SS), protein E, N-terminal domain